MLQPSGFFLHGKDIVFTLRIFILLIHDFEHLTNYVSFLGRGNKNALLPVGVIKYMHLIVNIPYYPLGESK